MPDRKKLSKAKTEWMNRFLDQEYLGSSGKLGQASNLEIVRTGCVEFDVNNPMCRCCRYYSNHTQQVKFGKTCPTWNTAFGPVLRQKIEQLALDGVRIGTRFLNIWHSRKFLIPVATPAKSKVTHSVETQQIAGITPSSTKTPPAIRPHKVSVPSPLITINFIDPGVKT